jgi:hypothetical protein
VASGERPPFRRSRECRLIHRYAGPDPAGDCWLRPSHAIGAHAGGYLGSDLVHRERSIIDAGMPNTIFPLSPMFDAGRSRKSISAASIGTSNTRRSSTWLPG